MDKKEFKKSNIFCFEKSINYSENAIVSKTVIKRETGNVSLFAFDKGEGLSEHTAPFDALIQIVDGKAEVLINKESYFLETMDSIIMPANIPHAVKANERFKMILTMIKG